MFSKATVALQLSSVPSIFSTTPLPKRSCSIASPTDKPYLLDDVMFPTWLAVVELNGLSFLSTGLSFLKLGDGFAGV